MQSVPWVPLYRVGNETLTGAEACLRGCSLCPPDGSSEAGGSCPCSPRILGEEQSRLLYRDQYRLVWRTGSLVGSKRIIWAGGGRDGGRSSILEFKLIDRSSDQLVGKKNKAK